jgi:hypothetical protein
MPEYIVTGTKVMKDGTKHVVRETAPSRIRAEWIKAHYVAGGYTVQVNQKENH